MVAIFPRPKCFSSPSTPRISLSLVHYGLSMVSILKEIYPVITEPYILDVLSDLDTISIPPYDVAKKEGEGLRLPCSHVTVSIPEPSYSWILVNDVNTNEKKRLLETSRLLIGVIGKEWMKGLQAAVFQTERKPLYRKLTYQNNTDCLILLARSM